MGCRLNLAEGESIRTLLTGRDTIVVNSCAVTNEAVRQTRQAIRRAHRESPEKRIIVTGCAAQLDPDSFAAMPGGGVGTGYAEAFVAEVQHFVRCILSGTPMDTSPSPYASPTARSSSPARHTISPRTMAATSSLDWPQ